MNPPLQTRIHQVGALSQGTSLGHYLTTERNQRRRTARCISPRVDLTNDSCNMAGERPQPRNN